MNQSLAIESRQIGPDSPAFVIAEIGVNHDGSVDLAQQLVRSAKACGADAVKLQIFRADALMHDSSQFAGYQQERCNESNPAEMLRRYELDGPAIQRVITTIRECGMVPIATPFSVEDVETIRQLKLPAIKIASPDLVNHLLLEAAARTGATLLVSTGAATIDEVHRAVQWLKSWNARFALLHCVSAYPTPIEESHLGWIGQLASFGVPVGFSDHTTESISGAIAVASGACVIEKHLTYDRNAPGPDHAASADPRDFAEYVRLIRLTEALRGRGGKCVLPIEQDVRTVSRQSLVLRRDLGSGDTIGQGDLIVQRPGTGISAA
ncbi:MAG TPA: N-acetylneuraminate synthase family protein, partial [Tepidisphaeraceae bacterium]|nr:N-acetylneuraminate synthase family protein [Tepidisphaeraceae bacterium]